MNTLRFGDGKNLPQFVPEETCEVYIRAWRCPECSRLNGSTVPVKTPEPYRVTCDYCGVSGDMYHPKPDFPQHRYVQIKP